MLVEVSSQTGNDAGHGYIRLDRSCVDPEGAAKGGERRTGLIHVDGGVEVSLVGAIQVVGDCDAARIKDPTVGSEGHVYTVVTRVGVDLAVASGLYLHKNGIVCTSAADLFGFHQRESCRLVPFDHR